MKCDVCLTEIPIGKDRCPNCGYRIKRKSTISSSTLEQFDHIESRMKMPEFDHIPMIKHSTTNKKKNTYRPTNVAGAKGRQSQTQSLWSLIITIILLLIIILSSFAVSF